MVQYSTGYSSGIPIFSYPQFCIPPYLISMCAYCVQGIVGTTEMNSSVDEWSLAWKKLISCGWKDKPE